MARSGKWRRWAFVAGLVALVLCLSGCGDSPASTATLPGTFFYLDTNGANIREGGSAVSDASAATAGAIPGKPLTHNPDLSLSKDPALSPDETLLAYSYSPPPTANSGAGADIALVYVADGSQRILVGRGSPGDFLDEPAWSPDGRFLYYSHRSTIYDSKTQKYSQISNIERVELATGKAQLVIANAFSPAPSPDETHLGVVLFDAQNYSNHLAIVDVNTGQVTTLDTKDQGFLSFDSLRFSQDGRQLLFSAVVSAEANASPVPSTPAAQGGFLPVDYVPARPNIAFDALSLHGTLPWDLWLWHVGSGFTPKRLTTFAADPPFAGWARDNQSIGFATAHGLYRVLPDGSQLTQFTQSGSNGFAWRSQ